MYLPQQISRILLFYSTNLYSGSWHFGQFWNITRGIIAKYHCKSCYYFFIIEAEKFSVTHKRLFFLRLKKTNTGVYVRSNLFTSMEEMIDSFLWNQYKPYSRQTTWNGSMKVIYKSRLSRSLQRWSNKATLLYHRFLLLYHYYVERVML